jgi:hypothetical protein
VKSFKRPRVKFFSHNTHCRGHFADFLLGMVILSELEEVNQIVEVAVDVNFGENAYG